MPRRANAGLIKSELHCLLVAKAVRLIDCKTSNAEVFAQLGRQHDAGLPKALDPVQVMAFEAGMYIRNNLGTVPKRAYLYVLGQRSFNEFGKSRNRLIANSEYACAALCEAACEFGHVGRITW